MLNTSRYPQNLPFPCGREGVKKKLPSVEGGHGCRAEPGSEGPMGRELLKFYTCLRVAASAKAGRYLFRLIANNEKL